MMKFTDFLSPENIRQGAMLSSKKRALEQVGKIIADYLNQQTADDESICPVECFANLFKREKLGSTCINHGIALPHAKLSTACGNVEKPIAVFLQLETPIDYEASDHKEVDLIFAIMFPEKSCESYKGILPQIAEKLSDKNLAKQLRSAETVEELWQLFEYVDRQEQESEE